MQFELDSLQEELGACASTSMRCVQILSSPNYGPPFTWIAPRSFLTQDQITVGGYVTPETVPPYTEWPPGNHT